MTVVKEISILQCNLNHCQLACEELNMFFEEKDITIALLQEPYCFKGRVRKLKLEK